MQFGKIKNQKVSPSQVPSGFFFTVKELPGVILLSQNNKDDRQYYVFSGSYDGISKGQVCASIEYDDRFYPIIESSWTVMSVGQTPNKLISTKRSDCPVRSYAHTVELTTAELSDLASVLAGNSSCWAEDVYAKIKSYTRENDID